MKRTARRLLCVLWLCLPSFFTVPAAGWAGPTGLPNSVLSEVKQPDAVPSGAYTQVRSWQAAGKLAGHATGHLVKDSSASDGSAWEAVTGRDAPSLSMLYGPYIQLPPGDYVAFFRIKQLEDAGGDTVVTLDACTGHGQDVLAQRDVPESDLTLSQYAQVPLRFHYTGGDLECRAFWPGNASVRIDNVTLFRLEGALPAPALQRALPASPSGKPSNLTPINEPRPFPDLFPRSKTPARRLIVVDISRQPADMQLFTLSAEGLINRIQPRVYCLINPTDHLWLDWMQKKKWIDSTQIITDPVELLAHFPGVFKGLIVTDPALPASKNVATMLAGVKNCLVASPRLARRTKLPVVMDLRGRWKTSVEAYRWAFDNLWPQLNHHVIACSWPLHMGLRDYLVENKVFIFWISGPIDGTQPYANPTAEARLMEQLFAKMPPNIPVMSYPWAGKDVGIGEGPGVTLFAEFAKYLVGSVNCSNLSVHSGIQIRSLRQKPAPPTPKLQRDKVYVSWIMSDGDNLPVLTVGNFPDLWKSPARGKVPIGWTASPAASMLIPDIMDYYYSTATPDDYFLGAVSGIGYTYPDSYAKRYRASDRQQLFDGFLKQTGEYMRRMDETELWIMNANRPELWARYAREIPFLNALFPDYGRVVPTYEDATFPTIRNVPVFRAATNWPEGMTREQRITSLVAGIRDMTPRSRPAFLHLFALNWFADLPELQDVLKRLGPDYVAVRPDQLAELYHQAVPDRAILLRAPQVAPAIKGHPLALQISAQNLTLPTLPTRVRVTGGLSKASVSPEHTDLKPGIPALISLGGIPSGGPIHIQVRTAHSTQQAEVSIQPVDPKEIIGKLPQGALRFVVRFEAQTLQHQTGHQAPDPSASAGRSWAAGKGDPAGHMVYGPYSPLPAGRYLALFRLKRTGPGTGPLVTVDTCVGGGNPLTGSREVSAGELPLGRYMRIPVVFQHPGGQVETRVLWDGGAPVALDCVDLWKLN